MDVAVDGVRSALVIQSPYLRFPKKSESFLGVGSDLWLDEEVFAVVYLEQIVRGAHYVQWTWPNLKYNHGGI